MSYDENGPYYTPDAEDVREAAAAIKGALANQDPSTDPVPTLSDKERRAIAKRSRELQRAVSLSTQRNGEVHATWEFAETYARFYGLREVPPHWRLCAARWSYTPAFDTYKDRAGKEQTRQASLAEFVERSRYSGPALRAIRAVRGVGRPQAAREAVRTA